MSPVLPPIKIWVLAPFLESDDPTIAYYYDFSQSIAEYTRCFEQLQVNWIWQPVTLQDYTQVIQQIAQEKRNGRSFPIVLNLCDGDEMNGTPGISVIHCLESAGLVYTGSDAHFYQITTSKIPMKRAFDGHGIPTPAWESIQHPQQDITGIFRRLGSPILLKPAVSGGSMGVGIRNVVETESDLKKQLQEMFQGYRGWNLATDGIIAEAYISGREFTTMVLGSAHAHGHCRVLTPAERVFHASLPEKERFLSFDRLWETYEDETPMPGADNFYEYAPAPLAMEPALARLSLDAYTALGGTGYTRVDLRQDQQSGRLYVLEANAQCGLSEDEDFTSIGAILRFSEMAFPDMILHILEDACRRKGISHRITRILQQQRVL
ncbi:MAG TPA: hypothetical protein VG842_09345 [Sediminibacterium sp.]|nr:hypothetical protein [Sediminibacterium sp.]